MKIGLLVWLAWDTDQTDVDLHVKEPCGNEVYYGNRYSSIGGLISKDFTQGYGPEIYLLPHAPSGNYHVRAKFYASHQASLATGTTSVVIWTFANLGTSHSSAMDFRTVRLSSKSEKMEVLHVEIPEGVFTATADGVIFESPTSSKSIGKFLAGEQLEARGDAVNVDGFTMLPIKPQGAVQMKYMGPPRALFHAAEADCGSEEELEELLFD